MLETPYLWCHVHGHTPEACTPTGIASARIAVPRTPVRAYTLHTLHAMGADGKSRVDMTKPDAEETQRLRRMTVEFVDESSTIDGQTWSALKEVHNGVVALPCLAQPRSVYSLQDPRRRCRRQDNYGRALLIMCVDFKQLPPASDHPHFMATDPTFHTTFHFRVLRENRRISKPGDADDQVS